MAIQTRRLQLQITVTSVATDGVAAFVTLSTFDSLWTVDTKTHRVVAGAVPNAVYQPPAAPTKAFSSRNERREWATSQQVTTVLASPGHLLVPFFRGTYNEGAVGDVAYRRAGGG